jgi:hypothetical protein
MARLEFLRQLLCVSKPGAWLTGAGIGVLLYFLASRLDQLDAVQQ